MPLTPRDKDLTARYLLAHQTEKWKDRYGGIG